MWSQQSFTLRSVFAEKIFDQHFLTNDPSCPHLGTVVWGQDHLWTPLEDVRPQGEDEGVSRGGKEKLGSRLDQRVLWQLC